VDVDEVLLPGIGIRYEFSTQAGDRVGLIARRDGTTELVVHDPRDPDIAQRVATLNRDEADTVAELLGAPRIAERFADLTREVPGLVAAQIEVLDGSRFAGARLGDTRARTLTGASVVAVVRGETVVASPGPEHRLAAGDILVTIGTEDGIAALRTILLRPGQGTGEPPAP
jgi:TrkA domain protein